MNDMYKQSCNCKCHVHPYNVKYVGTDKQLGYCTSAKVMKTVVTYAYNRYTHKDAVQMCHKKILRIHKNTLEIQNMFVCYAKANLLNRMYMQISAYMETRSAKLKTYVCVKTEPCVCLVYTNTVACSNVYDKNVKLSVKSTHSFVFEYAQKSHKDTNVDIGALKCNPLG